MTELPNILKILRAASSGGMGTCLNGTACAVLLEHIETLESQKPVFHDDDTLKDTTFSLEMPDVPDEW